MEQGFQSIKDLRLLGRDIKRTIIIDNLKENFWSTCPNNGIEIADWYGEDLDDTELLKLIPVLRAMAENEEPDIRKVIKHYRKDLAKYAIDFRKLGTNSGSPNPSGRGDLTDPRRSNRRFETMRQMSGSGDQKDKTGFNMVQSSAIDNVSQSVSAARG